jgi:hypothetical protein
MSEENPTRVIPSGVQLLISHNPILIITIAAVFMVVPPACQH